MCYQNHFLANLTTNRTQVGTSLSFSFQVLSLTMLAGLYNLPSPPPSLSCSSGLLVNTTI